MAQYGYSNDVFTLSFLTAKERQELMDTLNIIPGHRERMIEMFKLVEQLNPRQ